MMTDKMISKLSSKGRRWTKGDHDRIYLDHASLGLILNYYNSGNISSAEFQGEDISNNRARELAGVTVWIDLTTGEIHTKGSKISTMNTMREAAEQLIEALEAEIAAEEAAEVSAVYYRYTNHGIDQYIPVHSVDCLLAELSTFLPIDEAREICLRLYPDPAPGVIYRGGASRGRAFQIEVISYSATADSIASIVPFIGVNDTYLINDDGSLSTEFKTYRLAHRLSDCLVIVAEYYGGWDEPAEEYNRDYLLYLENGTWNEIHQSRRKHSVIDDLHSGSAYDEIRLCVGGRRFSDEIRAIVENSGILADTYKED